MTDGVVEGGPDQPGKGREASVVIRLPVRVDGLVVEAGMWVPLPRVDRVPGRRQADVLDGLGQGGVAVPGVGAQLDEDAGTQHVDQPEGERNVLDPRRWMDQPIRLEEDNRAEQLGIPCLVDVARRHGRRAANPGVGCRTQAPVAVSRDGGPGISRVQTAGGCRAIRKSRAAAPFGRNGRHSLRGFDAALQRRRREPVDARCRTAARRFAPVDAGPVDGVDGVGDAARGTEVGHGPGALRNRPMVIHDHEAARRDAIVAGDERVPGGRVEVAVEPQQREL